jgi:hypothetical protein
VARIWDIEILEHAAAGRVERRKAGKRRDYFVAGKLGSRAAVLDLLRSGLLEVDDPGDPSPWRTRQDIKVSIKGHAAIEERKLLKGARYSKRPGEVYKQGQVPAYPGTDRRWGPWELPALALEATVGSRIESLKKHLKRSAPTGEGG